MTLTSSVVETVMDTSIHKNTTKINKTGTPDKTNESKNEPGKS